MRLHYIESNSDLNRAASLRYRAYRDVGAIPFSEEKTFSDEYDSSNNSFNFLLESCGNVVAAIRACVQRSANDSLRTPAWDIYNEEISGVLRDDFCLIESNRYVTEPGNSTIAHAAVFLGIAAVAKKYYCTDVCTAVRSSQAAFYERFFGMQAISEPKGYHGLSAEMVLMWASKETFQWSGLDRLSRHVDFDDARISDQQPLCSFL